MSVRALASALAMTAMLALPAAAQPAPETSRVPTVTRLVKTFSELEARLMAGFAGRDTAAIEQIVDADFEMRSGSTPGTPVPRAEWIRQSIDKPDRGSIEQMAVHDFGSVAVVSFRQVHAAPSATNPHRDLFIVDSWKRVGDGWRLATRYLSDAAAPPSAAPAPGSIDKRY